MATAREAQRALKQTPVYRFGNREVDIRLRQIREDGQVVEAPPKAFDLLVYLLENRDRVVDKDELLEQLWPGAVVTESALAQIVRKARSLAGDDGKRQAVIGTVQRRGFRFVAVVQTQKGGSTSSIARASAHPDPSVAVLPFADMSSERDHEYFCDGMVEEIITELARIPSLRVAARTSSFAFKLRSDDVREIGRQLGVRSVLEGSVRKDGDKLRVTAQLIDASTGFHLWSERWDRTLEDMLAIQAEIGRQIAAVLRCSHGMGERAAATFTAEDLCDRAFAYLNRTSRRSQRFAMDLFQQTLAIDPTSVRAWAGRALSHVVLSTTASMARHRAEALRAATHATELNPRSAVAWAAYGAATAANRGFAAAQEAFTRAIELDPRLFEARHFFGRICLEAGEYERAAEQFEAAAVAKPEDYQALVYARQAYRSLHRSADERSAAARQVAAAERALRADPTDARALSLSSGSLVILGRIDEAHAWTRRSCELEPDEPYVHYNAACVLAQLGRAEEALTALESGMEHGRYCGPSWVEHDVDLAPLRAHPRFEALLARMRIDNPTPPRKRGRRAVSTA